jgi:hypothetical protein
VADQYQPAGSSLMYESRSALPQFSFSFQRQSRQQRVTSMKVTVVGIGRRSVWHIHSAYTFRIGDAGSCKSLVKFYQIIRYHNPKDSNVHNHRCSFIPLARAQCDNSLPFSGASSIPLCYVIFPATHLHQLFFHPPSLNLAIYFLVYLSASFFPNSYIILFWEFHFLPFSVHAQTNVIYLTLLSLL